MQFPLDVEFTAKTERYKDLTVAARKAIIESNLRGGQRMPSAKELANQMGVSRTTMVKVYQQLVAEGYLETRVGSGTFVKEHLHACTPTDSSDDVTSDTEVPVNFTPPADTLPGRQWQQHLTRYIRSGGVTGGAGILGYRPLRQRVAEFLRITKGVKCSADQIVILSGAQSALSFVASLLVRSGDLVVTEDPGDAAISSRYRMSGARIQSVPVDAAGLKVEELDQITEPCRLIHVSPAHHFPSGATMPIEKRKALLTWAERQNAFIVEDARDSDYFYGRGGARSIQGLSNDERVILFYDFQIVLHPLANLAVLVLPSSLIEQAKQTMLLCGSSLPTIEQFALTDFIASGDLQRHIHRSRSIYQNRRQHLIFNLSQHFLREVTIPSHSAGLHQVVRFHVPLQEADILTCAVMAGLPMVPTRAYYQGGPPHGLEFLLPFCMLEEKSTAVKIAAFKALVEQQISQQFAPVDLPPFPVAFTSSLAMA